MAATEDPYISAIVNLRTRHLRYVNTSPDEHYESWTKSANTAHQCISSNRLYPALIHLQMCMTDHFQHNVARCQSLVSCTFMSTTQTLIGMGWFQHAYKLMLDARRLVKVGETLPELPKDIENELELWTVLSFQPFPTKEDAKQFCSRVGCLNHHHKKCSRCRKVRYCGEECQRIDWAMEHKKICKKRSD